MNLTYNAERKRFEAKSEFSDVAARTALKAAGFAWDGITKTWHADHWKEAGKHSHAKQSRMAAGFVQFADTDARGRIDADALAAVELEKVSLETSRASESDAKLIGPDGLEYLGYQKAGILYSLNIFGKGSHPSRGVLIADEMGL